MVYQVKVHIVGEHKTKIDTWKYNIKARDDREARFRALQIAEIDSKDKFSRYRNCTFHTGRNDVVLISPT